MLGIVGSCRCDLIKLKGVEAFNLGIDKWLKEAESLAVGTLRGLAIKVFQAAIHNSPQFTGNAAANWKFSVNGVDFTADDIFKEVFFDGLAASDYRVAFSKLNRNDVAEEFAHAEARGKELLVLSLGDKIFISNSVDYAGWLATATEASLREVNHVGHLISNTVGDVTEAYLTINKATAQRLAAERI